MGSSRRAQLLNHMEAYPTPRLEAVYRDSMYLPMSSYDTNIVECEYPRVGHEPGS
jgi:hypothetical protein